MAMFLRRKALLSAVYRYLPEIDVKVSAAEVFVEHEYNTLTLEVTNRGYGIARDIEIRLRGEFDVTGDCCIPGLAPKKSKSLLVSVRPHKDHYGKVPLEVVVTYKDPLSKIHDNPYSTNVDVRQQELLDRLAASSTPVQITIQELYQHGARKVEGDEIHGRAQIGDRVDIKRGERAGMTVEHGETGDRVQIRRNGHPVRRCPVCNVPSTDPEEQYCSECGAPLDSECTDRSAER
jgi:hypothetical protein